MSQQRTLPREPFLKLVRHYTYQELAIVLGVPRSTARGIFQNNRNNFNIKTADELAVAIGMHPSEIWGEDWWNIPNRVKDNPKDL